MILASNEQLQQQLEYTLKKMPFGREDTLEEQLKGTRVPCVYYQ